MEGDISRFLVDDFISRVHARVRKRERMENFGELFSPKFITFYACARIRNKDARKT